MGIPISSGRHLHGMISLSGISKMSGSPSGGQVKQTSLGQSHSYLLFCKIEHVSNYLTIENDSQTQEHWQYYLSYHLFQRQI